MHALHIAQTGNSLSPHRDTVGFRLDVGILHWTSCSARLGSQADGHLADVLPESRPDLLRKHLRQPNRQHPQRALGQLQLYPQRVLDLGQSGNELGRLWI